MKRSWPHGALAGGQSYGWQKVGYEPRMNLAILPDEMLEIIHEVLSAANEEFA